MTDYYTLLSIDFDLGVPNILKILDIDSMSKYLKNYYQNNLTDLIKNIF
jgi:hypothetical protein